MNANPRMIYVFLFDFRMLGSHGDDQDLETITVKFEQMANQDKNSKFNANPQLLNKHWESNIAHVSTQKGPISYSC